MEKKRRIIGTKSVRRRYII